LKARVAEFSTSSRLHPTTSFEFVLDSQPPDTKVGNVTFGAGARNVNITMERQTDSLLPSDTHGWSYSLDGILILFLITMDILTYV
jgi:hypothetical protein